MSTVKRSLILSLTSNWSARPRKNPPIRGDEEVFQNFSRHVPEPERIGSAGGGHASGRRFSEGDRDATTTDGVRFRGDSGGHRQPGRIGQVWRSRRFEQGT